MERLVIAVAVLAAGAVIGWAIRRRLHRSTGSELDSERLPAGLVVVTSPYCTRCSSLRSRLDAAGIAFSTIDAASDPILLRRLDITVAPTVLKVLPSGRVTDRESRNFSDARLSAMASPPG